MKHESKLATLTATMADLDIYKDKVIVFEAVRASDTGRLITRQPLQPTNTQLLYSPRLSPYKPAGFKPSFDSTLDENHRAMHGQTPHTGTQSNIHSVPDRTSQVSRSPSQNSSSAISSSITPQMSVRGLSTPQSGATVSLSPSNYAGGSVDTAGFARYCADWRDRIQASHPNYDDSTYILVSLVLSKFNS